MPRTKPLYIYPAKEVYKNLHEELLDIHSRLASGSTDGIREQIDKLAQEVEELATSTSQSNLEINKELDDAKGVYPSINDRFLALDQYDILRTLQLITTTREFEYANGYIVKEKIRGDMNYDVSYYYDSYNNIIRETKALLDGTIISEKNYTYTPEGNVASISGVNTDDIMLVTNALVDSEQDKRLDAIEAIDFVELGKVLDGWDLIGVAKTVQNLVTQVEHLMLNLPENIGYLINTSEIMRRLESVEQRLDASEVYHAFDVVSTQTSYAIPVEIVDKKFGVYMEGLLLEKNEDYVIKNGVIEFLIPLIDGFTVTYKD